MILFWNLNYMKKSDGFKETKSTLISCLKNGNIQHEARKNIDLKNLLSTGEISIDDLIKILNKSRGNEHETSAHHFDNSIDVHIIKTNFSGVYWYIKWYFLSPECVFISVHN